MRSCLLYAQPGPNVHSPHYRCTLLCPWQMVTNNWSAKHTEVHAWVIAGNIGHDCPLISFYRTKHSKFQRGVAFYKKCKWTQLKYLQDEYLRVQFPSSIVHTSQCHLILKQQIINSVTRHAGNFNFISEQVQRTNTN